MILSRIARGYLVRSLDLATDRHYTHVYMYLVNPSEFKNILPLAIKKTEETVPGVFEKRVVKALMELNEVASRLENEYANPSPLFIDLARNVVDSIISGDNSALKEFMSKNFGALRNMLVIDNLLIDDWKFTVIRPKSSDITDLMIELKTLSVDYVISKLVRNAVEDHYFREFLYGIVRRHVHVDIPSSEVSVAGKKLKVSPAELSRLLIALNDPEGLKEHLVRIYGSEMKRLMQTLGTNIELQEVEIYSPGSLEANTRFRVDDASKLVGVDTKHKYQAEITAKTVEFKTFSLTLQIRHNNLNIYYYSRDNERFEVEAEKLLSKIVEVTRSPEVKKWLETLDNGISELEAQGYTVESLSYVAQNNEIWFTASRKPFTVEYVKKCYEPRSSFRLWVSLPKSVTDSVASYYVKLREPLNAEITMDDRKLVVSVYNATIKDIKVAEETASKTASKLINEWREKYERLPTIDAAIIYLLYKQEVLTESTVRESLGISVPMLSLKASRGVRKTSDLPPRALFLYLPYLYRNGLLDFDEKGHLRAFGKRIADVCRAHFKDESIAEEAEKELLFKLIKQADHAGELDTLFENKRIPTRIIKTLAELSEDARYEREIRVFFLHIAGNKSIWESLIPYEKLLIVKTLGDRLLEEARRNSWDWILTDQAVVVLAKVSDMTRPSEITKTIATEFPELLGTNYELVQVNGEYFIKHGRTYLQVRKVLYDWFLFQGAFAGSNVGMLIKAKNVSEASKIIQESLVDHVLEFKDVVNEMKSKGYNVTIGSYETASFKIPYMVLTTDKKKITIPLQFDFRNKVEKILSKDVESRKTLDEDTVFA